MARSAKSPPPGMRPLLPEVFLAAPSVLAKALPLSARPLLLPKVIAEAVERTNIEREKRDRAHTVFLDWIEKLRNGQLHGLTETQVEADFSKHLLAALGFLSQADVKAGADWNLLPKWTIPAAGQADIGLGRFRLDESKAIVADPLIAVVELKGAGVDLDRRGSAGRTPVQQAWDYLSGAEENTQWAIVSNYEEIRLYHRRKGRQYLHRVLLADLGDPEAFAAFYAVFHADSLLGTGTSKYNTSWMLHETETKQETVGDELYQLYDERRYELIQELQAKGFTDLDTAIQTAQKLLDRVLFIAFAEDRGLLEGGWTLKMTAALTVPMMSRWNNFQLLFKSIDAGDKRRGIPGYNGNLFKHDPILDDPDFDLDEEKWPEVFRSIGDFDYRYEVTVDVLGKIFERSITDIERIKAGGIEAYEALLADRRKPGQRKRQGVYYTAKPIVEYLVNAALQPAWDLKRAELLKKHKLTEKTPDPLPALFTRELLAWLDSLTVCDPACGSGAFLIAAYDWFEERRLGLLEDLQRAEPSAPEAAGDAIDWTARSAPIILRNNLYGADLSPESVEIAQLSLWIRTARRGQKLTDLSENVVCGNSVVDDPAVDRRAIAWKERFARVFKNGGFDAVVGNPPYVRQELLSGIKPHLQKAFRAYHGMADLYVYFYELGLNLLKPGARLAFVVTNKWMKAGYGEPLRGLFSDAAWVESIVDFGHAKQFFPDADVFPCFIVVRKPTADAIPDQTNVCVIPRDLVRLEELKSQIPAATIAIERNRFNRGTWNLEPKAVYDLLAKIRASGTPLAEFAGVRPLSGIKLGLNDAFLIDTPTRDLLIKKEPSASPFIRPYLRGQDISRWSPDWAGMWMIALKSSGDHSWPWANLADDAEACFKKTYPALHAHLSQFKTPLIERHDQGRYWWELRSCAYWDAFDQPKIMYPEITWHLQWCFDDKGNLCNNTAYALPATDLWVLAVLNTPINWWLSWRTAVHGKDEALRFIKEFVDFIAVPRPARKRRSEVETSVRRLIQIETMRHGTRYEILDWLHTEYDIAEPGKKLESPVALSSDQFVAEVKKRQGRKKSLSVAALKALRDEYSRTIEPARTLANEALALEYRISDLVNEACGLTPDEIRLMWDTAPPRMPIPRPPGV